MRKSLVPALLFLVSSLVQAQEGSNSVVADGFMQGHPYEITFAKQLSNTFKLVFAQDELRESWPYYGYKLSAIRDDPCQRGAISRDLTVGDTVAFVRPQHGPSHDFTGLRIGFAQPVGNGVSVGQICDWIREPRAYLQNIAAELDALASVPCMSSGAWSSDEETTLPTDAQPMMTGRLTTDMSDDSYALLWNEQGGGRRIVWEIVQGGDGTGRAPNGSAMMVWKYTPSGGSDANASSGVDFYLTYPSGSAIQTDTSTTWECQNDRMIVWPASFSDDGIPENLLSMWYMPSSASTVIGDDWYLLIDDLLPTLAADIRIERGALEQGSVQPGG